MRAGNYIGILFLILGFIFGGLTIERQISYLLFSNKIEANHSLENAYAYTQSLHEIENILNLKLIYLSLTAICVLIGVSTILYMKAISKRKNYSIT